MRLKTPSMPLTALFSTLAKYQLKNVQCLVSFSNLKLFIVCRNICIGDASKPKAWSKYAADSTAYKKAHPPKLEAKTTKKEKKKVNNVKEILDKVCCLSNCFKYKTYLNLL